MTTAQRPDPYELISEVRDYFNPSNPEFQKLTTALDLIARPQPAQPQRTAEVQSGIEWLAHRIEHLEHLPHPGEAKIERALFAYITELEAERAAIRDWALEDAASLMLSERPDSRAPFIPSGAAEVRAANIRALKSPPPDHIGEANNMVPAPKKRVG